MNLGELIIAYRKENNLSQRQFAKKCGGVSNGYVSMLENNFNPATSKGITPSLDKLICIAAGMDMSLSELLEKAEDMPADMADLFAQNTIFEDEDEKALVCQFMRMPKEGTRVKEPEQPAPSSEALEIARRYDTLDMHGREIIRAVMRIEDKRCEKDHVVRNYLKDDENKIPIIGEIVADGSVEAKYAAKKELYEMQDEKVDV